jgi:acylphosphatase
MIAYRIRYSGQVQGVYFRATAREFAKEYGLTGNVRNLPDGSVELFVQGFASPVTAFLADLAARYEGSIQHEDRQPAEPEDSIADFEVLA